MSLHPLPPSWFELVVPEADVDDALEALARRGGVQFEWTGEKDTADQIAPLREISRQWQRFAADHARFWPAPVFERRCCTLPLEVSARAALHQLELWRAEAATLLAELNQIENDLDELRFWQHWLPDIRASELELELLTNAGPTLVARCVLWPETSELPLPSATLSRPLPPGDGRSSALVLTVQDQIERLCHQAIAAGGRCLKLPDCLSDARSPTLCAELSTRIEQAEKQVAGLEAALRELAAQRGVGPALGVLERIDWFLETAAQIRCDDQCCWITGWSAEPDPGAMNRTLREIGVAAELKFMPPPQDAPLPSVTGHPHWLQPFEVFADTIGVPGLRDADPTTWVAVLVPLLFGYMCGDVGHGALILLAGLLLRRRTRMWPLLVVCGLASVGFGFVYGDVFGFHGLIPPLWLHPLDDPLLVLAVPVAAGALVLTLGVLLHALQTCWRGEGRSGGIADAAQLLTYWGLMLAVADLRLGWLAVAGVVLCVINRLWHEPTPLALAASLGHLLESTLQLLLNTVSFARVGAFALAHAALESAIVGVAVGLDSLAVAALVVIIGNLVIVVLETVVVGVQTTRLVLFEFFMRFFEGKGRPFLPVIHPPAGTLGPEPLQNGPRPTTYLPNTISRNPRRRTKRKKYYTFRDRRYDQRALCVGLLTYRRESLELGPARYMSDLLKIVYEVAAVRSDYLRIHRRLFHVSAGRLMRNLTRRQTPGCLTNEQELEELNQRLSRAINGLSELKKEDLSIRRGSEIQNALSEYVQALTESIAALATLLEVRKRSRNASQQQPSEASQATKIAYDDAVQYHKRLGARLSKLLMTL